MLFVVGGKKKKDYDWFGGQILRKASANQWLVLRECVLLLMCSLTNHSKSFCQPMAGTLYICIQIYTYRRVSTYTRICTYMHVYARIYVYAFGGKGIRSSKSCQCLPGTLCTCILLIRIHDIYIYISPSPSLPPSLSLSRSNLTTGKSTR